MQYFQAKWLFDGNQWLPEQVFAVDDQGWFIDVSPDLVDGMEPSMVQSLGVVIPGFINCHSHSFQRGMAGLGERCRRDGQQDSFWSWRQQMYQLVQTLNPDSFKQVADWLYVEMLEAGFTSVGEFHYLHNQPDGQPYADRLILAKMLYQSAMDTGIRLCLLPVLYKNGGINQALTTQQLAFQIPDIHHYQEYHQSLQEQVPEGHGLGVCAHSIRGVDRQTLREFAHCYNPQQQPIHIHVAEQQQEVSACLQHYGTRPVQFLLDAIGINDNWTLVHGTHIEQQEINGILAAQAVVGICPLTEANLGDGIFPMVTFMQGGGRIAMGSDSHIRIDPFEELRWIEYSQRYQLQRRACLADQHRVSPGFNLAQACYRGGEQSLQLKVGRLQQGFRADFIELDQHHPALLRQQPETLWDELIFAAGKEVVKNVYVGGIKRVSQGKHHDRDSKLAQLKRVYCSLNN